MRIAVLLVLASCTHDIAEFDRIEDVETARDLDILYVFDTSSDRASYDLMASQLDVLQTRLTGIDGQLPSLHVGVVTADLGTSGTTDGGPSLGNCAGDGDGGRLITFDAKLSRPFLEDLRGPNGTRIRDFESEEDADLAAELGLLTNPSTVAAGCEIPQPFEAMRRALDPEINPDFLRDGAKLQVVFLTTDDDCSLARGSLLSPSPLLGLQQFRCTTEGVICDDDVSAPGTHTGCRPREDSEVVTGVSRYEQFLRSLKRDRRDIVVSAVAGPRQPFATINGAVTPSCDGPGGSAKPAVRIGTLVDAFGGSLIDGCAQDAVYEHLTAPLTPHSCFPALTADDGDNCRVIEVVGDAQAELASCTAGGTAPCWYTFADPAACPVGENRGIAIDRRSTTAPAASRIEATCFVR